jgi:hypothetical protein
VIHSFIVHSLPFGVSLPVLNVPKGRSPVRRADTLSVIGFAGWKVTCHVPLFLRALPRWVHMDYPRRAVAALCACTQVRMHAFGGSRQKKSHQAGAWWLVARSPQSCGLAEARR